RRSPTRQSLDQARRILGLIASHRSVLPRARHYDTRASMSLSRVVKVNPGKTAFLICDLQERIRGVIWKFDDIVYTANKMLKMAKILNVPVLTTEQHPRVFGSTVSELKYDHLESLNLGVFAKTKFSMITQEVEEVIR
ncbi:hypothetical protein RSAG8_00525, partial [Rhizoctonia solani AG-8 WAC10335]